MRFGIRKIAFAFVAMMAVTTFAAPTPVDVSVDIEARGGPSFNPRPFAAKWGSPGNSYPIVMVHGLFGWGEKPLLGRGWSSLLKYWGGLTSDIVGRLRDAGYKVHVPAMGPASSNWERACELYAQITGTRVDYGIARSKKFGHARFGNDYTGRGLYPDFAKAPNNKIHLIGHSMGGPTGRMFAHLMAFGSQEEVDAANAAGVPVSPFFLTNKGGSYVSSFTAVAGVLRGSTFDDYLNSSGLAVDFLLGLIKVFVGANNAGIDIYDFQLGHWGLNPRPNEELESYIRRICTSPWFYSKSNALFDLTVYATKDPLLSFVKNSPDTTYFSFTGDTTYDAFGNAYAYPETLLFLQPLANIIGSYDNTTLLGSENRAWRPNDGLVPVVAAKGDNTGYNDYSLNLRASNSDVMNAAAARNLPVKGRFNFLQTLERIDHLEIVAITDIIGGQMDQVFLNVAGLQASLPN
ncbi:hypothetical protein HDU97_001144 [Phlyctochytrium planicorne]|nr:hypothetical protein HDU97_001144 [Phlyctochytrium planicorne]